jgi:PAS domain S-box-containing protein
MRPQRQHAIEMFGVDGVIVDLIRRTLSPEVAVKVHEEGDCVIPRLPEATAIDAVLLGLDLQDPVCLAQHIHAADKHIPILILADSLTNEQLRRTLMFSPFLGSEVRVWSSENIKELPDVLLQAVTRRRRRRRYQDTLANAEIHFEVFPLLQPNASHYLNQLLEHLPIGVVTVDLAGTILTLNKEACAILAVNERAALGTQIVSFFTGENRRQLSSLIDDYGDATGKFPPTIIEITHEGRQAPRAVEVTAVTLSYRTGQRGIMLMLQDVTAQIEIERARQRAGDELRLHASVLRAFHEISSTYGQSLNEKVHRLLQLGCDHFSMPIGLLTQIDGDTLIVVDSVTDEPCFAPGARLILHQTFCSAALGQSEPIAIEHVATSCWREHASYLAGPGTRLESYLGTRVRVNGVDYGTLCFFSRAPRETPFSSGAKEILKLMSQWIGSELQREYAEADMRKLSGAVEQTADSVIITDREGVIEYVNASFENLTGYTKMEMIGREAEFYRARSADHKFHENLFRSLETGDVFHGALVGKKKDGTIFHEQKTISPLRDRKGKTTHLIATGRDITELIAAQENDRLRQAELAHVARLSTLGEMTSGLAHELNQPLCAITTYAQTCLRIIQSGDGDFEQLRYGLDKVVAQAELGGKIFRRLRDFARKGSNDRQLIHMRDIINEVVGFIGWETQHKLIHVSVDLAPELPTVRADPIQIEQVLLNLVRNSIDAIAKLSESRRRIDIRCSRQKSFIVVSIRDHGRGCSPEQVLKLFEPFFTTKSEGLGIGLTVSQSLIEAHGGRLWLKSNSRRGATFCFNLPIDKHSGLQ